MFIIVLGQHVSILIESSSDPSKIQILTKDLYLVVFDGYIIPYLYKSLLVVLNVLEVGHGPRVFQNRIMRRNLQLRGSK